MESEYRDTLAIIEQQTARLSRIVDDMFTLARADAGNYPVRRDAMYLDEVVDEAVRAGRVLASTKDVDISLRTLHPASLVGDEDLIRRLVGNLLDNAIRHTPPGGCVQVELQQTADGYALSISDSGPGIPADSQPHIFERFYRLDRSRIRGLPDGGAGSDWLWLDGSRRSMGGRDVDQLVSGRQHVHRVSAAAWLIPHPLFISGS